MHRRVLLLLGLLPILAVPSAAQERRSPAARQRAKVERTCNMVLENYDSTSTLGLKMPSGQYNWFYGKGVRGHCTNTDQKLAGDSLELIGDSKSYTIIGHAHYQEEKVSLDADRIYYYQLDERVVAEGNVVSRTKNGTIMRGPRAEYFRAIPNMRPLQRMIATGRPTTKLSPADAGGGAKDTVELVADNVVTVGDSLVYAGGTVVITRPDLVSTSDSATMDSGTEFARLMGRPRVVGRGDTKFTLTGRRIDLWSKQRKLERVLSADSAHAVNEDVTLASDTIDMRLTDQQLERAYAWGKHRATAHSNERDIVADSIDVRMPGQSIRELRALRNAIATSRIDSTKFQSKEDDWLRGDTIIAVFDSVKTPGDTTNKPQITVIHARGTAASYYQVASSQGAKAGPNVNYVKGRTISVDFNKDRTVGMVTVKEKSSGVYLELQPPDSVASDSSARRPAGNAKGNSKTTPAAKPTAKPGASAQPPVKKP